MTSTANPQSKPASVFWNRVQLIMVLVVFAAPIVGAFLYQPTGYVNYGDLYVPVRPVDNLELQTAEDVVELESLRRQWVFLVVAQNTCDEVCEENILKIRQLRFMQNNDMQRIRTLFVYSGLSDDVATDLEAKYRPMEVYAVEEGALSQWKQVLELEDAPEAANKDRIYIIDPTGNLMMSYPSGSDPSLMKKDLKRLLKTSQVG